MNWKNTSHNVNFVLYPGIFCAKIKKEGAMPSLKGIRFRLNVMVSLLTLPASQGLPEGRRYVS
jgi:hypothetical protein